MKRLILLFLLLILFISLIGCGQSNEESIGAFNSEEQSESVEIETSDNTEKQNERNIELLKEQCPEYFELSSFKGIEVYVWETEDGAYRCGMMSGTNRMKTDSEIQALEQKSLSITEAKMVLEGNGIEDESIIVIPITQPYVNTGDDEGISATLVIDEERAEQIFKLLMHN